MSVPSTLGYGGGSITPKTIVNSGVHSYDNKKILKLNLSINEKKWGEVVPPLPVQE